MLEGIRRGLSIPTDNPELIRSQARALSRHIPMMYGMLVINSLALAATHLSVAPPLLSIYIPAVLTALSIGRMILWWRTRNRVLDEVRALRLLRTMVIIAGFLGLSFSGWALSLYPYGNAFQQSHIAFYIGITTIACFFSLLHLRAAALIVAITVGVPFCLFFFISGNPVFVALAFNFLLVVGALIMILLNTNRNFAELVNSRRDMVRSQVETQKLSDENYRLAHHDSLTGLPNRLQFFATLEKMLAEAEISGRQIAVGRMDLDGFKSVNDIFGHVSGDRLLVEVGARLMAIRSPTTFIARLGGDVFALVMEGPVPDSRLTACGKTVCDTIRQPFTFPGVNVRITASVGFASSRVGDTAETIYDRADYASFVAKEDQRGGCVVFSEAHESKISKVRSLEHALLTCNLDDEIYIMFQPQFDVALNRTIGYEVLARWRSPVLGEVSPGEFIPLAERTGIISKITQTVLRKALLVAAQLPKPLRLSVNLSAHDLGSQTAIEAIAAMVRESGMTPCRVDFEITETAVMRDLKQANTALLTLLSLGSRIALDDFGTGHSSLTYVQKLPLDRIKVDRSFVAEVCNDPASRAIVKTTVDLCRNLGIACVFEGIETEEQLEVLLALGGTLMQGYLFSRPISEELVLDHYARERVQLGGPAAQGMRASH
ncbi:EAL domain-containing protein [Devosia sp.]